MISDELKGLLSFAGPVATVSRHLCYYLHRKGEVIHLVLFGV